MNSPAQDEFIIYDTEFWTDEGVMDRRWNGVHDYPPLLIQIGAIKVAATEGLPILDEFLLFVRPQDANGKDAPITDFFTKLTNITAEQVANEGVLLDEALKRFHTFTGGRPMYSYGHDMLATIVPSCFIQSVPCPFGPLQGRNVCKVLHRAGMSEEEMRQNSSGTLASYFGIEPDGHWTHDALCDARSIHLALRYFHEKGSLDPAWLTEEVPA